MNRQLPLDSPAGLLSELGKDPRLVPYGGGNFGMPLEFMEPDGDLIVPNDRFFLRSNGPVPELDPATWRLEIGGWVEQSVTLTLADLAAMPSRTLTSVLECAGNGRTEFDPVPDGTPWRHDAAGCAVWEGVPLAAVLDFAGVRDGAVDIVAQGGDFPEMRRGLPLGVARSHDTMIALKMNGEPLPVGHGGPARLLVPGWAGIANTKWLVGLEVLDRAFDGIWNTKNYVIWSDTGEALRPVETMGPRAVISSPQAGSTVKTGPVSVSGYAWSGHGAIAGVQISADGGATWQEAPFTEQSRRSWVRWTATVEAPAGELLLMCRATDERTISQPVAAAWNLKGYQNNSIQRIALVVEA
jgi:DMSO/TMAO reductase YedYZ molybdopterin-dependent catalytic subunit